MAAPATDIELKLIDVSPDDEELFTTFMKLTEAHYIESEPEESSAEGWFEHYKRQICERVKTDVKRWLWLVEHEGNVVGLANFYLSGPEDSPIGTIQELYVCPKYRNRHIGRTLFHKVKDKLGEHKAKQIKASVALDEPGNMKFFESYGFRLARVNMVLNTDQQSA